MTGKVVSKEEWLVARKELLAKEKAASRARDEFYSIFRSGFPMVKLDKDYHFTGPNGKVTLGDIAEGRKQLIVYHFMFGPEDDDPCTGCSFLADNLPSSLGHLNSKQTTLVLVSRAPFEKIEKLKQRMRWNFPWYSSFGSDFNYDFHVSVDSDIAPPEYNYKPSTQTKGEAPGLSVFFKEGNDIFHTYSTYGRGTDILLGTHTLLDLTPLGRQNENPVDWKLRDEY